MENLDHVRDKLGRMPAPADMVKPQSKHSYDLYYSRFGRWDRVKRLFHTWKRTGRLPRERSAAQKTCGQPSDRLTFMVFTRDGFKCVKCGKSPTTHPGTELQVDHIKARNKGGLTIFENLRTLCRRCNIGKGNL